MITKEDYKSIAKTLSIAVMSQGFAIMKAFPSYDDCPPELRDSVNLAAEVIKAYKALMDCDNGSE